jgi:uncharacterized protein (TIGR00251 family)
MSADAVQLKADPRGVLVKVAARPGTGADRVMGVQGDALKLGVSAAPEKGKANKALAELLAKVLGVRKSAVGIVSGETSREKLFLVEGATVESVRAAIAKALGG